MALLTVLPGQQTVDPQVDVVLLPHAGALVSTYIPWADPLKAAFRRRGVHRLGLSTAVLPGHLSSTEKAPSHVSATHSLERYGERLAKELKARENPDRPLMIFGHSMGALLAVETVRNLSRYGVETTATVLSGSAAPVKQKRFARKPIYTRGSASELRGLSDEATLETLKKIGGISQELAAQPELAKPFLPQIRADFDLVDAYRFEPPTRFSTQRLVTLSGSDDHRASEYTMRGWHELLGVPGQHHEFTGDHFFHQQHIPEIADVLAGFMTKSAK